MLIGNPGSGAILYRDAAWTQYFPGVGDAAGTITVMRVPDTFSSNVRLALPHRSTFRLLNGELNFSQADYLTVEQAFNARIMCIGTEEVDIRNIKMRNLPSQGIYFAGVDKYNLQNIDAIIGADKSMDLEGGTYASSPDYVDNSISYIFSGTGCNMGKVNGISGDRVRHIFDNQPAAIAADQDPAFYGDNPAPMVSNAQGLNGTTANGSSHTFGRSQIVNGYTSQNCRIAISNRSKMIYNGVSIYRSPIMIQNFVEGTAEPHLTINGMIAYESGDMQFWDGSVTYLNGVSVHGNVPGSTQSRMMYFKSGCEVILNDDVVLYVDDAGGNVLTVEDDVKVSGSGKIILRRNGWTTGGPDGVYFEKGGNTEWNVDIVLEGTGWNTDVAVYGTGAMPVIGGKFYHDSGQTVNPDRLSYGMAYLPLIGNSAQPRPYIRTVTSGATTTLERGDDVLVINKSSGSATTVNVTPSALMANKVYTVKDGKGDAGTNNITITPASGTIDGAASYVVNTHYRALTFYSDGTNLFSVSSVVFGAVEASKLGHAYYADGTYTSGSPLAVNNARVKLENDGAGASTTITRLPSTGALWDTTNDNVDVPAAGARGVIRVDFKATPGAADAFMDIQYDIGSGGSVIIGQETLRFAKGSGVEQRFCVTFPFFAESTFAANGCALYLDTTDDAVNVDVYDIGIHIQLNGGV